MSDQFVIRPEGEGFSVIDLWTGEPASIAMARQVRLSEADAVHVAVLLNQRAQNQQTETGERPAAA